MGSVLILILVEVALGGPLKEYLKTLYLVLILILVEVALGEKLTIAEVLFLLFVLILILVEVALGAKILETQVKNGYGLNPYFSGSCSWRFP